MGKSSKKLSEAINECYKEEENVQNSDVDDEVSVEEEAEDENEELNIISLKIVTFFHNYVHDNSVHMCEYIDSQDIETYICTVFQKNIIN